MKKLILFTFLSLLNLDAMAMKNCTDQPKDKWMSVKDFKSAVTKKGFKIKKFKQPGTCYEIYGKDKDGKEVEVYFNPVNLKIIKIEFED
jgi:hypothetical protein